ncbi:hypothetical protein FACS1894166_07170 [Bacilli bacterium]|nr:hypothetical protein FACS1894166_07170 [Bacilli bacterium]
MQLASAYRRSVAYERLVKIASENYGPLADAINALIAVKDTTESKIKAKAVMHLLQHANASTDIKQAIQDADLLPKKST